MKETTKRQKEAKERRARICTAYKRARRAQPLATRNAIATTIARVEACSVMTVLRATINEQ